VNLLPEAPHGVPITEIGKITEPGKLVLLKQAGRERQLRPGGWDSFQTQR
jgi:hypothetical protein